VVENVYVLPDIMMMVQICYVNHAVISVKLVLILYHVRHVVRLNLEHFRIHFVLAILDIMKLCPSHALNVPIIV